MTTKEPGRICWVCRKRHDYARFNLQEKVCDACRRAKRARTYRHTCAACGEAFASASQRAKACSEPCRKARKLKVQRAWRAHSQGNALKAQ